MANTLSVRSQLANWIRLLVLLPMTWPSSTTTLYSQVKTIELLGKIRTLFRWYLSHLSHATFRSGLDSGSSSPQYIPELPFLEALTSCSSDPCFHSDVRRECDVRTTEKRASTDGDGSSFNPSSMKIRGSVILPRSNDTVASGTMALRFDE